MKLLFAFLIFMGIIFVILPSGGNALKGAVYLLGAVIGAIFIFTLGGVGCLCFCGIMLGIMAKSFFRISVKDQESEKTEEPKKEA